MIAFIQKAAPPNAIRKPGTARRYSRQPLSNLWEAREPPDFYVNRTAKMRMGLLGCVIAPKLVDGPND